MNFVKNVMALAIVCVVITSCSDPKTGKPVPLPGAPTYAQLEKALEYNQGFLNSEDPEVRARALANINDILKKKKEVGGKSYEVASNSGAATGQVAF